MLDQQEIPDAVEDVMVNALAGKNATMRQAMASFQMESAVKSMAFRYDNFTQSKVAA